MVEGTRVNRMFSYATIAVVLGLSATMIPLITIAQIKPSQTGVEWCSAYSKGLEKLDDPRRYLFDSNQQYQGLSPVDLRVPGISFFVALIVYVLFRRKSSRREYRLVGPYPYQVE